MVLKSLEEVTGETSIILKDFLCDEKRERAMVRVIVAEKSITQHVWISVVKGKKGWCVGKASGHTALPTKGVAMAIHQVYQAVCRSCVSS